MITTGSYILSALALAALVLSLGLSAVYLRRGLLPAWTGAPARLVESIAGIALLVWLSELLGLVGFLYAWSLVASSLLLATAVVAGPRILSRRVASSASQAAGDDPPSTPSAGETSLPGGGAERGAHPEEQPHRRGGGSPSVTGPAGPPTLALPPLAWLITVGVIAVVFAHWGLTAKDALDRGIFNFDSLWYHMPFAVEMAHSHSVTHFHYTDTVFTNWLYPQNSELLHAVGILLTERDTLSLFINFGFLALAFLAAWCIGRPYGRGHLTVMAAAVLLECHTLVVREPGAAKNDVVAAALLLAAVAILVNARRGNEASPAGGAAAGAPHSGGRREAASEHMGEGRRDRPRGRLPLGWPVATAGLAAGLAVGTKSTALAMAAALTVAVLVLAPAGRRWAAAGWWFLPALAGGGFWYLRNLIATGNPLPQLESLGPVSLPHPEQLQTGRPDFSIVHYATDTGVWRDYFGPGLEQAFGTLWPLVIAAALAGGVLALARVRDTTPGATFSPAMGWTKRCTANRVIPWIGAVALFAMLAYLFTPLSAAGAEGAPTGFAINIRYAIPALLAGLVLLPLARAFDGERRQWALLAALLALLVATNRADAVLRDPDRLFGLLVAVVAVLIPAALLYARRRGASLVAVSTGFAVLGLATVAIGYPIQRDYLHDRFRNDDPETAIPGFDLDSAYRWARDIEDSRIGLAGTTAGFLQYGFYGTDLSNRVLYLGAKGPEGAFNAIETCRDFRTAVNVADLDYLVTAPFLNFIDPADPIPSPEAGWLRGESAVTPIQRSGPVTVWKLHGKLDPSACGPINAPLHRVPDTPEGPSR